MTPPPEPPAASFFPPFIPRGSWAPGSPADRAWEQAHQVRCTLWALRRAGALVPPVQLLQAGVAGFLMLDRKPRCIDGLEALFWPGERAALEPIRLPFAHVVKETWRLVQLGGRQHDRASDALHRQTWFAAVSDAEGRAVLAAMVAPGA